MLWFESHSKTSDLHKGCFKEKTVSGRDIELEVIQHDEDTCQEFVVHSSSFSYRSWMMWTVVFNILGFMVELHTQDPRTMTCLAAAAFLVLMIKLYYKVTQESLLVIKSLGVQITTKFMLGPTMAKFYDWDQIHDLVINEAVTMHKVIFYLTLLLRETPHSSTITKLVPLFTHSWPALHCLQQIYQGTHQVLGQSSPAS